MKSLDELRKEMRDLEQNVASTYSAIQKAKAEKNMVDDSYKTTIGSFGFFEEFWGGFFGRKKLMRKADELAAEMVKYDKNIAALDIIYTKFGFELRGLRSNVENAIEEEKKNKKEDTPKSPYYIAPTFSSAAYGSRNYEAMMKAKREQERKDTNMRVKKIYNQMMAEQQRKEQKDHYNVFRKGFIFYVPDSIASSGKVFVQPSYSFA